MFHFLASFTQRSVEESPWFDTRCLTSAWLQVFHHSHFKKHGQHIHDEKYFLLTSRLQTRPQILWYLPQNLCFVDRKKHTYIFLTINNYLKNDGRRPHWQCQWSHILPSAHSCSLIPCFSIPTLWDILTGPVYIFAQILLPQLCSYQMSRDVPVMERKIVKPRLVYSSLFLRPIMRMHFLKLLGHIGGAMLTIVSLTSPTVFIWKRSSFLIHQYKLMLCSKLILLLN